LTLEQKIRDVLARLSTLSEAPAGDLEEQIAHSSPVSAAPGDATLRDLSERALRDRSLHDWYRDQFALNASDAERLLSLYLAAEREYFRRTIPELHRRTAEKGSILAYSQDGAAVESIAAKQMIEEFEGVHALDVAIIEGKTEAWVIKVRKQHDRRPDDGRPRAEFLDWDDDRRRREVAALAANHGQKVAADKLRISKRTLQRYWPTAEPVAA
jgi:hypothetical protein